MHPLTSHLFYLVFLLWTNLPMNQRSFLSSPDYPVQIAREICKLSIKGQMVNVLGFCGWCAVSVTLFACFFLPTLFKIVSSLGVLTILVYYLLSSDTLHIECKAESVYTFFWQDLTQVNVQILVCPGISFLTPI